MSFETIPALLADLLQEQRITNERIASLAAAIAGHSPAVQADKAIEKAKVAAPKSEPAAAQKATSAPVASTAAQTAPSEPLSYDVVSKAITDKVKTNRDHVVATLAKFGAKKGTELKAEQYEEFLAAL